MFTDLDLVVELQLGRRDSGPERVVADGRDQHVLQLDAEDVCLLEQKNDTVRAYCNITDVLHTGMKWKCGTKVLESRYYYTDVYHERVVKVPGPSACPD